MGTFTRKLTIAVLGALAFYLYGPILPTLPVSADEKPVLVDAPEPSAARALSKAPPAGLIVQQLPRGIKASGNPNHVPQLTGAQLSDLTKRANLRNIENRSGHFAGVVDANNGAYRITFVDGYLPSGRKVLAFGIEALGSSQAPQAPVGFGRLALNASAATRQFLKCSYETVDPATNNLFLHICPIDAVTAGAALGVIATVVGAYVGFLMGGPVGALVGAMIGAFFSLAILFGLYLLQNQDFSIDLVLPPVVWQNLNGWFYTPSGQNAFVNGNPCFLYWEGRGWYQGCQLSDTMNWVGVNLDGRLEPFVIGGGNNLYSKTQLCNPNCGWTGWMGHGGGNLVGRPTLASDINGELNVMAVGSGGNLRENFQSSAGSSNWVYWYTLGCCFTGNVAIGRNVDGRLEAVVRNANGNIDHYWENGQNGAWNGYGHLMCCFASSPTIESNTDGRLEVFAIDNYQNLWHKYQVTPNGGWSAMQNLGCCLIGNPKASRFADGSLVVFGIGTDHNLYYKRQTSPGAGWSYWTGLGGGGNLVSEPVGRLNVDGRMEVFVIDSNNHLRDVWENSPNGSWSWGELGCCVKGDPDVQININGLLEAFAIGMDNGLWHKWQSGPGQGPWTSWQSLGGVIVVTP